MLKKFKEGAVAALGWFKKPFVRFACFVWGGFKGILESWTE